MKWLQRFFGSRDEIKYLRSQIDTCLKVCQLLQQQDTNLSKRIRHLEIHIISKPVDNPIEEKHTEKGRCLKIEGSPSHVCMRGDIPMDARDYGGYDD